MSAKSHSDGQDKTDPKNQTIIEDVFKTLNIKNPDPTWDERIINKFKHIKENVHRQAVKILETEPLKRYDSTYIGQLVSKLYIEQFKDLTKDEMFFMMVYLHVMISVEQLR